MNFLACYLRSSLLLPQLNCTALHTRPSHSTQARTLLPFPISTCFPHSRPFLDCCVCLRGSKHAVLPPSSYSPCFILRHVAPVLPYSALLTCSIMRITNVNISLTCLSHWSCQACPPCLFSLFINFTDCPKPESPVSLTTLPHLTTQFPRTVSSHYYRCLRASHSVKPTPLPSVRLPSLLPQATVQ